MAAAAMMAKNIMEPRNFFFKQALLKNRRRFKPSVCRAPQGAPDSILKDG